MIHTWGVDASGEWSDAVNWNFFVPNGNDKIAIFGDRITSDRAATVDTPVVIKEIRFDDDNSYNVTGSKTVTLEADTGNASVNVLQGSHQFQAAVSLASSTDVDVATGGQLVVQNDLGLGNNTLTKTGDGELQINSDLTTPGGTVDTQAGRLSGVGKIGGNLDNAGASVAPGKSIGVLELTGNYVQSANGALEIEIAGMTHGSEYDFLDITGSTDLGGLLNVDVDANFSPAPGTMFTVLTADGGIMANPTMVLGGPDAAMFSIAFEANDVVLTALGGLACDFDGSGGCDIDDLDDPGQLYDQLGSPNAQFDLDNSGTVDDGDLTMWLAQASADNAPKEYKRGDADLDGDVEGNDFTALALGFGSPGTWGDGNFVVDAVAGGGNVAGNDFTELALNFGHTSATAAGNAVPEPTMFYLMCTALLGLGLRARGRGNIR